MLDRSTFRRAWTLAILSCAISTFPAVRSAPPPATQQKPAPPYVLRVIIADTLAKQKYARAEQWMDFGVR